MTKRGCLFPDSPFFVSSFYEYDSIMKKIRNIFPFFYKPPSNGFFCRKFLTYNPYSLFKISIYNKDDSQHVFYKRGYIFLIFMPAFYGFSEYPALGFGIYM